MNEQPRQFTYSLFRETCPGCGAPDFGLEECAYCGRELTIKIGDQEKPRSQDPKRRVEPREILS